MSCPSISVCVWNYDRTQPLLDGRIKIEGFQANYTVLDPEKAFPKAFVEAAFDVIEMSLSYQLTELVKGNTQYAALPIFPSRAFRHSTIYVRTDRGISEPRDLSGKTIGAQDYDMTAAVIVRAFLREDYGVTPTSLRWMIGDEIEIRRVPRPTRSVEGVEVQHSTDRTLDEMLELGGIDALISLRAPPCFVRGSPRLRTHKT